MDDFDLKRLKLIGNAARKAKVAVNNAIDAVDRWNQSHGEDELLKPPMQTLLQATDVLMDLNNACNARERKHQIDAAKGAVSR